mmetsp:Transcript_16340/g.48674  ORF Transcript_16340/g.48674 Transcript_16340/m.48674 type:complete len:270 (-) Transcript_16340:45-854(-)
MWWLVAAAGLYVFRGKIAQKLAPLLPQSTPQKNAFFGHCGMLLAGCVYALPIEFLGLGAVKRAAWLASLWSTIITAGLTLKANYGAPPMPQQLSIGAVKQLMQGALQPWLQQAMMSVDFHFLFFSLIFVAANPSIFPLLILGRRSLWSVATHCTKNPEDGGMLWPRFKPTWEKLKAKEPEVLHYSALGEILLALWLTASLLLPNRQFFTCFLYWNYLKTRYAVPRSQPLHDKAWRQLGQQVEPVLKMAPFLQKPIDMAKGWFKPQYQTR